VGGEGGWSDGMAGKERVLIALQHSNGELGQREKVHKTQSPDEGERANKKHSSDGIVGGKEGGNLVKKPRESADSDGLRDADKIETM